MGLSHLFTLQLLFPIGLKSLLDFSCPFLQFLPSYLHHRSQRTNSAWPRAGGASGALSPSRALSLIPGWGKLPFPWANFPSCHAHPRAETKLQSGKRPRKLLGPCSFYRSRNGVPENAGAWPPVHWYLWTLRILDKLHDFSRMQSMQFLSVNSVPGTVPSAGHLPETSPL